MKLTYLEYLFLDVFSTFDARKANSLYHVLAGKRTVSVMLQALRYHLTSYFAIFPTLRLNDFQDKVHGFVNKGLLKETEDGYLLTETAHEAVNLYFVTHTRITNRYQMKYAIALPIFKRRVIFLGQVLSESAHENSKYLPVQSRVFEQNWIKSFIQAMPENKKTMASLFGMELLQLVEQIKESNPDLFVEQLEGNKKIRKTAGQLAENYGLEEAEVLIIWQQAWLQVMSFFEEKDMEFPIIRAIYQETVVNGGLFSKSTQESYYLWSTGKNIAEIAGIRRLKESTINDHISEVAMIDPLFPFAKILSKQMIRYVEVRLEIAESLRFEEIQEAFPEATFFENRLMQIMSEVKKLWSNTN